MRLNCLLALYLSAICVLAVPHSPQEYPVWGCSDPSPDVLATSQRLAALEAFRGDLIDDTDTITISTFVHIIAENEHASANLGDHQIKEMVGFLNEAFAPGSIRFELQDIDRLFSRTQSNYSHPEFNVSALGEATYRGDLETLNLWVMADITDHVAGLCIVPYDGMGQSNVDGCMLRYSVLPPNQQGQVVVHEIGHWLGLAHTFQDSCEGPDADGIADTPVHLNPQTLGKPDDYFNCRRLKSCANVEGDDPVANFMNYSQFYCLKEFTAGQRTRMRSTWWEVRVRRNQETREEKQLEFHG